MLDVRIIQGDCIEGMRSLDEGSFNLIVADPPYNLNKDFGPWKETERKAEWREWTRQWLEEAMRRARGLKRDRTGLYEHEKMQRGRFIPAS